MCYVVVLHCAVVWVSCRFGLPGHERANMASGAHAHRRLRGNAQPSQEKVKS